MKNSLTYNQFLEATNNELDRDSLDQLLGVQDEIKLRQEELKEAKKKLTAALLRRCESDGKALLRQAGKYTGTVTVPADDDLSYKFEIPKKVEWDQVVLRNIVEAMAKSGENVDEYVNITLTVPEGKYNAWPQSIREKFNPARIVHDADIKAEIVETKKKAR